ncbi:hypothetical protein ABQF24_08390 [Xanthomonas campestris pv. campestris]|nr:hypothetical protein [Xanthomonas campestris]
MARSPLWGRRIHLAGSIHGDTLIATSHEVSRAREYVRALVKALMKLGQHSLSRWMRKSSEKTACRFALIG